MADRPDKTTLWVDTHTKDQLRAAAALLGINAGDLLARLADGDGPPQGENLVDWAQRLAAEKAKP